VKRRAALWMSVALVLPAAAGSQPSAGSGFRLAVVARGLDSPVHVVAAPGEPRRLYVVEQRGTVRVVERGRVRPGFFLDLRGQVSGENEQGLLGLAFDPRYARNRFLYVNYTDRDGDTRIVRFRSDGRRALPGSARLLLRVDQPHSNHNGGNLVFGPGGFLYVGLGDGGGSGDPEDNAQNPRSLLGKMLRLDVRRPGARPALIGLGLRNPWRYSFDRATGDLYLGDVGWRSREEVDYTPRAKLGRLQNYGWDLYEGSLALEDKPRGPGELVQPVYEYDHDEGCTVIGGFVYRGAALPGERGRYVFGDFCEGTIWSLRVVGGRAQDLRVEPFRIEQLTSFGESLAGELFATSRDGTLYRLT
jgi:glucose/arabinose dehydrogenase